MSSNPHLVSSTQIICAENSRRQQSAFSIHFRLKDRCRQALLFECFCQFMLQAMALDVSVPSEIWIVMILIIQKIVYLQPHQESTPMGLLVSVIMSCVFS